MSENTKSPQIAVCGPLDGVGAPMENKVNTDIVTGPPSIVNRKPARSTRGKSATVATKNASHIMAPAVVPGVGEVGAFVSTHTNTHNTAHKREGAIMWDAFSTVRLPTAMVEALDAQLPCLSIRRRERCLYLLSLVTSHAHCHAVDRYYRPLNSAVLKTILGKEGPNGGRWIALELLEELIDAGFVERLDNVKRELETEPGTAPEVKPAGKGTYIPGKKSKQYRCAWKGWRSAPRSEYRLYTLDLTPFCQDRSPAAAAAQLEDPALRYLAECYEQSTLDVRYALQLLFAEYRADLTGCDLTDYGQLSARLDAAPVDTTCIACAHAHTETAEELRDPKNPDLLICRECGESWNPRIRAQKGLASIWYWVRADEHWCLRDPAGRRLHTPVTSLLTELRPALKLCGSDRLVSLDLKCSQLVIAASWMRLDGEGDAPDAALWLDIAENGGKNGRLDLYQQTYAECHGGLIPDAKQRKAWKKALFQDWWYAREQVQTNSEIGKQLAAAFPTVHAWILRKKGQEEGAARKKRPHAAFPIELQRRESAIFIDDLALRLQAAGIVAVTVHDSVVVREEDAEIAERLMRDALASLGVRVQVERSNYFTDEAPALALAA